MVGRMLGLLMVSGIVVAGAALARAQVTRPGDTIQLWEYHTEVVRSAAGPALNDPRGEGRRLSSGVADTTLNAWGRNGWELVGITRREVRVEDTLETESLYVFKRATRTVNR